METYFRILKDLLKAISAIKVLYKILKYFACAAAVLQTAKVWVLGRYHASIKAKICNDKMKVFMRPKFNKNLMIYTSSTSFTTSEASFDDVEWVKSSNSSWISAS